MAGNRAKNSRSTGLRVTIELPRSPWRCCRGSPDTAATSGRSKPYCAIISACRSGDMPRSPTIIMIGSPGTSRIRMKATKVTPRKVGTRTARRAPRKRSMSGPRPPGRRTAAPDLGSGPARRRRHVASVDRSESAPHQPLPCAARAKLAAKAEARRSAPGPSRSSHARSCRPRGARSSSSPRRRSGPRRHGAPSAAEIGAAMTGSTGSHSSAARQRVRQSRRSGAGPGRRRRRRPGPARPGRSRARRSAAAPAGASLDQLQGSGSGRRRPAAGRKSASQSPADCAWAMAAPGAAPP